ncbi:sulfatase/phosphatase domain-containing protein [Ruania rhizosphaerae]|uniref:sulfatase/phosphatase domain-containing protein n=1 Tax=Ruania rhizosphaerae TaxID=1840413 RepID=UPI00190F8CF1|nr:sulfatase/phosphatase domain-containing protein [Ruania rhizosphaerae]
MAWAESLAGLLHLPRMVAVVVVQRFGLSTQRAIRTTDWKYIWNATDVDELYDLRADPHELTNLSHEPAHAETMAELRRRLYGELEAFGDGQVTNAWVRRQLLDGAIA